MTLKEAVTAVLKDVAQTSDYATGVEDIMTLLENVKKTENTLSLEEESYVIEAVQIVSNIRSEDKKELLNKLGLEKYTG